MNAASIARAVARSGATASLALAMAVAPASAGCSRQTAASIQGRMSSFLIRPVGLLEQYPHGEKDFTRILADLVAYEPITILPKVIALSPYANLDQKNAIGRALSDAAERCRSSSPMITERINSAVIQQRDSVVLSSFLGTSAPGRDVTVSAPGADRNKLSIDKPFDPIRLPGVR